MHDLTFHTKYSKCSFVYSILLVLSTFMIFRTWVILERDWLLQGIIFIMTLFVSKKFYQTNTFSCIFLYILFMFFNVGLGDNQYNSFIDDVIMEFLKLSIPCAITFYVLKKGNLNDIKIILIIFYFFVIYTSIVSTIINVLFPGIIRDIVALTNGNQDTSAYNMFFRIGLSNYYLPHCLPTLIPALYLGIRTKSIKKLFRVGLLIAWISIILLTYCSGATTALLFSLFFSVAVLILNPNKSSSNNIFRIIIIVLLIPILFNKSIIYDLLLYAETFFYGTDFYGKILNFEDILMYEEVSGSAEGRANLYQDSLIAFSTNILVGSNAELGGHSAILDRLASLGIAGFLPFISIFIFQYQFVKNYISKKYRIIYIYGLIIAFVMLILKYMLYYEMTVIILTILPLSIIYFEQKQFNII